VKPAPWYRVKRKIKLRAGAFEKIDLRESSRGNLVLLPRRLAI
jgi:hypothetical protein